MWQNSANLCVAAFLLLFVGDADASFSSIPHYDVIVFEGKQLDLFVENFEHERIWSPQWYHNNRLVSSPRCELTYGKLACFGVTSQDAGRYELRVVDPYGRNQQRVIFSANVTVKKEPTRIVPEQMKRNSIVQMIDPIDQARWFNEERKDCFCSGVTDRCWTALDLYRIRKSFNLSNVTPTQRYLTSVDTVPSTYLGVPMFVFDGNLITAYGGFMYVPVTEECRTERHKPCVVITDKKNRAIGYFLPQHFDQPQVNVRMHESHWRVVSTDPGSNDRRETLDKNTFMTMLTTCDMVYVRGTNTARGNVQLIMDMASPYDTDGLGRVTTVEECDCHPGYAGLSCERCEPGFMRLYEMFNANGVCTNVKEIWQRLKKKYGVF